MDPLLITIALLFIGLLVGWAAITAFLYDAFGSRFTLRRLFVGLTGATVVSAIMAYMLR